MRPTVRQLEYLVALADTLHFRRAAEVAFVSQPGLSAQIRQLERLLGVRLFERDRRRVLATPAGEAAARRARHVLSALDTLVDEAGVHAGPLSGRLRLGVIPTVAPYLLPRVLPAARKRYPRLRLLLREDETSRLVERLEDGRLDLLLLALEADLGDAETHALFEDPFLLAAPRGHRLTRRRRVRQGDLEDETVLLLEDGH
jgi:LysR family hydrogen peroxide-inducible transcriptional activator